jgi:hypothetical protein
MQRITLNITEEQSKTLKRRAQNSGVQQSEQIRRAIDVYFATFPENQNPEFWFRHWKASQEGTVSAEQEAQVDAELAKIHEQEAAEY